MKKINVNKDACIGCGACVAVDPQHFDFNDEGLSNPISQENLDSKELADAISSCPTAAISIIDIGKQEKGQDILNSKKLTDTTEKNGKDKKAEKSKEETSEDTCDCSCCEHCHHEED